MSVGVEGILTCDDSRVDRVEQAEIDKCEHLVRESSLDENLKKRLEGFLDGINSPRANDILHKLVKSGKIQEGQIRSWSKLRNKVTHPKRTSNPKTQEMLDLCGKVLVLFYHIVFGAIGYAGLYNDYGEHGYPQEHYPPQMKI